MSDTGEEMTLIRMSFPVTGQPIRVVMIDGGPWFVTADVCRVLGYVNPSQTAKMVSPGQTRTVNRRLINLNQIEVNDVSADGKPYERGNPMINVVSESGLYTLIMRSQKKAAHRFQRWVTDELLPSVRRGDTDVPKQQQRMAETLSEAIGQQVHIVAEIKDLNGGPGYHTRSDGTVHCRHGEMLFRMPSREEDSGPPFGPYWECQSVERVGIRGGRAFPHCSRLKLVDLTRRMTTSPPTENGVTSATGVLHWDLYSHSVRGHIWDLAALLRELGQLPE